MTAKLVNAGVDAIFVCQTGWQAGVYNCIHDMGLEVGKDIAVTGFDNEKDCKLVYSQDDKQPPSSS